MKEISIQDFSMNPFTAFGDDWMALTAGNERDGYNAMTIAWGHIGSIWGRKNQHGCLPTAICYVRPQRYTKQFMDREEYFTISHFPERYRKALGYIGSRSGRDEDKIASAGFTPAFIEGTAYLAEADIVFVCKKIYTGEITESGFVDKELVDDNYPERDFHTVYMGEVIKILKRED